MKKTVTQDQIDMKLANLIAIFNLLYDKTPISRADLAKLSGMSPTSITRFISNMLTVDLLRETPSDLKKVGRMATMLRINENAAYSVGISIDSTYIHVSLLNFRKKIVAEQYQKTNCASPSLTQVLIIAYELYLKVLELARLDNSSICGIGLSIAGTMNGSEILDFTPQLKWKGLNIRKAVMERFQTENVVVENDCNAAVLGQCVLHPEYKEKAIACLCLGSGVGSAISYNGSLFAPPGGIAFSEIGHSIVEPDGMLCDCGNRGCLQTFMAEGALIKRAREQDPSISTLEDIHTAWLEGSNWARELIDTSCTYAKIAVNNLACVYNPEVILICGETIDNYWDMFQGILKGTQPLFYPFWERLKIMPFFKMYESSIIGVSQQVQDIYLKKLLKSTL